MITIVGGELLSALPDGDQKIEILRTGKPKIGTVDVTVGSDIISYPYFCLDDNPHVICSSPHAIDTYLDRVVETLLLKCELKSTDLDNVGVFLGSSSIDYSLAEAIEQVVCDGSTKNLKCERVGGGGYANRLMKRFAFDGPSLTHNTACTSSANALMDAASMLEGGIIDYALVFGLEVSSPTTLQGFVAMQLLTREKIRPFDINRSGMVLGEVVSVVLLSREDLIPSSWSYLGGSSNCETYSITGSDPNGEGIAQVIQSALDDTQTQPQELTAVKAHGTSSDLMDLAELRGMEQVFDGVPPYFSLKPYLGHTLGGCGVAELVLVMECVDAGFIPATINFNRLEREFSQPPIGKVMPLTSGRFMLNYFGFGGNNTSFIIEK